MTDTEKLRDRPLGVALGSLIVVIGAALPWAGSGERDRTSFELVQFADRNDLLPGTVAGVAVVWLLAPFALAAVLALVALGRPRLATGVGLGLAAATAGLALALRQSPLDARYGVAVSLAGAVLILADAVRQAVRS